MATTNEALADLVNQIRKTNPIDDHGHKFTMNMAYIKAEQHLDAATSAYDRDEAALREVFGCFKAAEIEGLSLALAETADAHLKDLVQRRLMFAQIAAADALEHRTTAANAGDLPIMPPSLQTSTPASQSYEGPAVLDKEASK